MQIYPEIDCNENERIYESIGEKCKAKIKYSRMTFTFPYFAA